jgi:hypothetical protein
MDFPLDPNLGALEIGFLASAFMFGLLTVQALIYNRKFAKDHWALKSLVCRSANPTIYPLILTCRWL